MLSIKEKQRKEIYKEKKGKEIMKREAVELLFNSIKNEEKLVKRLALLIERTNDTILEDACAPVATSVLVDVPGVISYLEDKYPGFTFKYQYPVFKNNDVEGLKFDCNMPERYVMKAEYWQDPFKDPYSLTPNEEFTDKKSKNWTDHTFPLGFFSGGLYEVKYL